MIWWLLVIAGLLVFSVAFGAPYVPTHSSAVNSALEILDLKPGQLLLELGAGDGRLVIAAAKRGIKVVAYEINPLMWLISTVRTWRYRQLVRVRLGDFRRANWPQQTAAIYVFANERILAYLAQRLAAWPRSIRLVSYGFALPGAKVRRQNGALWRYDL